MKKLFAVLVILVLVASVASAQLINAGPKVQLNFANLGGDRTTGLTSATLVSFGGFATYKVDPINIVGEVLYDQKGCSLVNTLTLGYLGINVLASYPIPMEGNLKPMVFAGPSVGFLMSASQGGVDVKNSVAGTDFGIIIGAGASYKLGTGAILLDVRYSLGLANINNPTTYNNTNQVFSVCVGYAFDLK
jgi:hypothetical protein